MYRQLSGSVLPMVLRVSDRTPFAFAYTRRSTPMTNSRAQYVIEAVRARGGNPRDLRDAAHEASHAIEAKVPDGKWERESVHGYILKLEKKLGRSAMIGSELRARAVEQIVCRRLGTDPGTVDRWALVSAIEAAKRGLSFISVPDAVKGIQVYMETGSVIAIAEEVLSLPERKVKGRLRVSDRTP